MSVIKPCDFGAKAAELSYAATGILVTFDASDS
jgi:hypothetical protein